MKPGTKLYGYCNGHFGRDSYDEKTIVASGKTNGERWIVVTNESGQLLFTSGFTCEELAAWKTEDDFDEES